MKNERADGMHPILPLDRASVFFDATLGPVRLKHPEGLAIAGDGAIWCGGDGGEIYRIEPDSCYEPSRLFRATPDGRLELLIDDPDAHTFCHPTNCAFRGSDLFTANLGRWHITRIEVGIQGLPLL
jgi:sugar lactone lactonase YvrE